MMFSHPPLCTASQLDELEARIAATGRDTAVPQPMERKLLAVERAAAKAAARQAAIEAQEREEAAIAALDAAQAAALPAVTASTDGAIPCRNMVSV